MITDRMPREKVRRFPWVLLRCLKAGWYWSRCKICGMHFDIRSEMGIRPLGGGHGEIVCWWCAWEGRDGALPFMVSYLDDEHFAMPDEYWKEPLRGQVMALVEKHRAWRASRNV